MTNLKTITQRLTTLEASQGQHVHNEPKPAWYQDMPPDLKRDVAGMDEIVKAAGGLSADPLVLATANRLATFITEHNRREMAP